MTPEPSSLEFDDSFQSLGEGPGFLDSLCGMLEGIGLFRDLERKEIEAIARRAHAYEADVGSYLFREGGRDSALFVIASGRIKMLKEYEYRQMRTLAVVNSRSMIGEMSVLDGQPFSASALVVEPTEFVLITRRNIIALAEMNPVLGCHLLWQLGRIVSMRLRQANGQLVDHLDD